MKTLLITLILFLVFAVSFLVGDAIDRKNNRTYNEIYSKTLENEKDQENYSVDLTILGVHFRNSTTYYIVGDSSYAVCTLETPWDISSVIHTEVFLK